MKKKFDKEDFFDFILKDILFPVLIIVCNVVTIKLSIVTFLCLVYIIALLVEYFDNHC